MKSPITRRSSVSPLVNWEWLWGVAPACRTSPHRATRPWAPIPEARNPATQTAVDEDPAALIDINNTTLELKYSFR